MFVTVFTFVTVFQLLITFDFDNSTSFSKIQRAYSSEMSEIAFLISYQHIFDSLILSFK